MVLDSIAEIKQIDAIVCDAGNVRLSERLMARLGWEPHQPSRWHRNYIRRFYGVYPGSVLESTEVLATPTCIDTSESVVLASR